MLRKNRTFVVVGLLAGLVLAGCTKSGDPQPSAGADEPATPVWSVRTQAVAQPELVDGLLVGEVVDPDSPTGTSVVVWDDSGTQLWRHDGRNHMVFDLDSATTVASIVYRSQTLSLALADLSTGTESLVAIPGDQADSLHMSDGAVYVVKHVSRQYDAYPEWSRLDTASMTLLPFAEPPTQRYPAGISVESGMVSYEGDGGTGAWSRPYAEMFEVDPASFVFDTFTWYGDQDLLLASVEALQFDLEFDRSQQFTVAGFAPDGTTVWKTNGYPCSAGEGGWTTGDIQVLCVPTGTMTYTTASEPGSMSWEPTLNDTGSYWVGVDVHTGAQKWRFPPEGTHASAEEHKRYAPLTDEGYVLADTADGAFLVDVATGAGEPLDPDGAFLCTQWVRQPSPEVGTVFRTVHRICDVEANPAVGPWNATWIRLTAVTDGKGRYYLATASQLVAFQL